MFVVSSFNMINKKMQDEMYRRQGNAASNGKPEGHVTIDPGARGKQNRNQDDGDYVDYEEIK
jgi:hypothetical protein